MGAHGEGQRTWEEAETPLSGADSMGNDYVSVPIGLGGQKCLLLAAGALTTESIYV